MSLNLIIGCGGSGITTMTELNRLLSQNPQWLPKLSDEVYYLAVDTEMTALEDFKTKIEEQMGAYAPPYVEMVQLSDRANILSEVIHGPFIGRYRNHPDAEGLKRLREHWWFDLNHVPFLAPRVKDLKKGAGQCPPASYGLAWWRLEDIEAALNRIVDRMVVHGDGNPQHLQNMNLFVVSGLSGGTGRGCWNLIAFKLREYLQANYKLMVPPIGVFFDANVFESVAGENEGQETRLKLNALTGLSELSCWMVNGGKTGDDRYEYRLPNMKSPEQLATDVLQVNLELNPDSGAPVGSAYLVCGRSPSAKLSKNEQYHEMAGAAIYAMIAKPDISARAVNDNDPYNSFAAATFEVDTLHIRKYFETRARGMALGRLALTADDPAGAVQEFLARHPLNARIMQSVSEMKPNPEGTAYQRIAFALLDGLKGSLAILPGGLKKWKPKEAERRVAPLLSPRSKSEIKKAVQAGLAGYGVQGAEGVSAGLDAKKAEAAVVAAMNRVYLGEEGGVASVGRALEFLKSLKAQIDDSRVGAPASLVMSAKGSSEKVPGAEAVKKALEVFGKRTLKEVLTGVGAYNDDEISKLCKDTGMGYWGEIPMAILAVNYPAIKEALEELFAPALARIGRLINGCEGFADCCRQARAAFASEEAGAAGVEGKDAFSALFCRPSEIDRALYDAERVERVYHRVLMPIKRSPMELDGEVGDSIVMGQGLLDFITESVESGRLEKLGGDKGGAERSRFLSDLMQRVRQSVSLKDSFMEDHFSFVKVLEGNLPHWNRAIEQAMGDGVRMNDLKKKFKLTLGAEPMPDPQNKDAPWKLPPLEMLQRTIAASLASTCAPWWIAETEGAHHSVMMFVPFDLKREGKTKFDEALKREVPHRTVSAFGLTDSKGGATLYSYVAYVNEGILLKADEAERGMHLLDKVTSLGYWHDPDVMEWLQMAERDDGESIFSQRSGNKGCGYVSPIYVREKKLAGYRWKPWMKDEAALGEALRNQSADLMLYAMLGMGLTPEQAKKFAEKLAPYKVRLPLLKQSETGQVWTLARKTLVWSGAVRQAEANTECSWNAGKKVCTSVCNLDTLLRGKGRTGKHGELKATDVAEGNALKAWLEAEMRMFDEHVRSELGSDYRELCQARLEWLVAQRDAAEMNKDKEDLAVFEALVKRATVK